MSAALDRNVGGWDRAARIAAGAGLLACAAAEPTRLWAWFGLFPLLSGLTARCPLYGIRGWTTRAR